MGGWQQSFILDGNRALSYVALEHYHMWQQSFILRGTRALSYMALEHYRT